MNETLTPLEKLREKLTAIHPTIEVDEDMSDDGEIWVPTPIWEKNEAEIKAILDSLETEWMAVDSQYREGYVVAYTDGTDYII